MAICALCKIPENQPLKNNTHFLTDGIIRSAINYDGSNDRDKGFYGEFSSSPYVDYNFQRKASENFSDAFGREANNEEINNSKSNTAFSVDNVFCKSCEDKFTSIETMFQANISKPLREKGEKNLIAESVLLLENSNLIRVFFLLQIWRTNICDSNFKLLDEVSEELRNIIWEYSTGNEEISKKHPLIINYMETLGGGIEYTTNPVGYLSDKNPFIIYMNDFIIQFYESEETLKYTDFYGLNSKENFKAEVNLNENKFKINIKSNQNRIEFIRESYIEKDVANKLKFYKEDFKWLWNELFHIYPTETILNRYINQIIHSDKNLYERYSEKNISEIKNKFISESILENEDLQIAFSKFLDNSQNY